MGSATSRAAELQGAELENMNNTMAILESKRESFIEKIKAARGPGGSTTEVAGGRTCTRVSDLRVSVGGGLDSGITDAIASFFEAAQGGDKAKKAAVKGAEALIGAGIEHMFGQSTATSSQKEGFVCLFLNFAFVRIDYYVYAYNSSGMAYGMKAYESGSCYVADIAVLDIVDDLRPSEIDFLLGQALCVEDPGTDQAKVDSDLAKIHKLKIQLAQSVILSRMLKKEDLSFDDIVDITEAMKKANDSIKQGFDDLDEYEPKKQNQTNGTVNPAPGAPAPAPA